MSELRIDTIDLRYLGDDRAIASYIVRAPGGPIMIETGPGSTTAALTAGLARLGLEPRDVKHVLVTHIHFDHAGAAGWMVARGAQLYVHEFGARHIIDPSRLIASATRIYGDRMKTLWGEILPCAHEQVTSVHDGDELELNGVTIRAIGTPGHARHHHAYALETGRERIAFTGDAAATFVAESPTFISVPTPPPEFEPERWLESVDRLAAENFDAIYPTHFGRVDGVPGHLDRVKQALNAHTRFVEEHRDDPNVRSEYLQWFINDAREHGVPERYHDFYVKSTLADMNVSGILRWLEQRGARDRHAARARARARARGGTASAVGRGESP